MQYWEILILCIGLSLDVFAVAVCEGALLERIKLGRVLVMSAIFCLWQVGALALGRALARFPRLADAYVHTSHVWRGIAAAILFLLAGYLIYRALRRKPLYEHRSELSYRRVLLTAIITSVDALLVGFSSGFLYAYWLFCCLTLLGVTVLCVILGVLTGYHFGYEQKTKAYWCGGVLFLAAAVDVLARHLH